MVYLIDNWDSVHLDLIEDFSDPSRKADVVAVVMHEGLAHVCLLKDALTKVCARIERSFPKKKDSQAYAGALLKFFDDIYAAIQRSVNFEVVKVVLVGSPAFLNQDFLQYAFDRAVRNEDASIIKNKSKFLRAHCSSGHKRSIEEMLAGPDVMAQLGEVKAAGEVGAEVELTQ
jgi:protein pelota